MRGMARGGFANIMQGERTMNKLWAGRSEAETSALADAFNSSIAVDGRMYRQDITGSMAHAAMLAKCGILTQADTDAIIDGLAGILADLESGALQLDPQAEDIHMFVDVYKRQPLRSAVTNSHWASAFRSCLPLGLSGTQRQMRSRRERSSSR